MRTHPVNISYLVMGLIFLGIAACWALLAGGTIESADVEWLVPLGLVLAGGAGLAAFAARELSRRRSTEGDHQ